ncbi:glycoside hydrolase family 43 protein [Mucilaginibacter sp. OK098]|uniref:glycoside hydrolase family 43 protein n=1 Tax=Mucilaginibacter sp. OK098 TaxID=1855297 RepID=UPI00091FEE42|nr:glycoside hydrolase family 43 protein [Mucilaginibacter sp. OK098]SHL97575.1 Glycosyl hydrolases family 43 [Mucilaginibacter sp. OK098]
MKKKISRYITVVFKLASLLILSGWVRTASAQTNAGKQGYSGYLFVYFTGNDRAEESIHFATSTDGYRFAALNNNKAIFSSVAISETGGVRDPHILRGNDGKTFYMVATDMVSANGWNSNRGMVLLKSEDLIHWSSKAINIQQKYPNQDSLLRVWAPQTIFDPVQQKYMVYWSMKYGAGPDRIYYAYANAAFTDLTTEPKVLFSLPDQKSSIDADIIFHDGIYHLFFKTEGNGNGIKQAVSAQLTGVYSLEDRYLQQTDLPVEGSGVFSLINGSGFILMYDMYTSGRYQFTFSKELEHFKAVDQDVSMNFNPRHGTVMPITEKELQRLLKNWKKLNVN